MEEILLEEHTLESQESARPRDLRGTNLMLFG
jgi:hypothetical protein